MKNPNLLFNFKLFNNIIKSLEKQFNHDVKCSKNIQEVFNDNFITGYNNTIIVNQLIYIY